MDRLKLDECSNLTGIPVVYDDRSGSVMTRGPQGGNLTVGVGHNLSEPMSPTLKQLIFNQDLATAESVLLLGYPWYAKTIYGTARGDVLAMVQFNTGKVTEFVLMLAAAEVGNWTTAAAELMNSDAARQLSARYGRMEQALLTNSWAIGEA